MIGCLTLPFRLLGLALIVLVLVGAWLYRDRIVAAVRDVGSQAPPALVGRPGADPLRSARTKVAALERTGTDSVVLDADEAASLVAAGLDPVVSARLDSLTVRLGVGRIAVSGLVETGRLPADLVGPLSIALRDRERITAGGPLTMAEPGRAAWTIDEFQLRNLPFPRDVVPRIVERALGDETDGALSVRVPAAVRAVRVEPQGVILFRDRRP
jgi:hypothetical protein